MECYLIDDAYKNPVGNLLASIEWLRGLGGGTVVSDLRRNLEGTLKKSGGEFDRYAERLARDGVSLTWRRKGLPHSGNVVAAYTTPDVLHMLDESEGIDRLLVLGWSERDWKWWDESREPTRASFEQ